jgi:hypothetical protein
MTIPTVGPESLRGRAIEPEEGAGYTAADHALRRDNGELPAKSARMQSAPLQSSDWMAWF